MAPSPHDIASGHISNPAASKPPSPGSSFPSIPLQRSRSSPSASQQSGDTNHQFGRLATLSRPSLDPVLEPFGSSSSTSSSSPSNAYHPAFLNQRGRSQSSQAPHHPNGAASFGQHHQSNQFQPAPQQQQHQYRSHPYQQVNQYLNHPHSHEPSSFDEIQSSASHRHPDAGLQSDLACPNSHSQYPTDPTPPLSATPSSSQQSALDAYDSNPDATFELQGFSHSGIPMVRGGLGRHEVSTSGEWGRPGRKETYGMEHEDLGRHGNVKVEGESWYVDMAGPGSSDDFRAREIAFPSQHHHQPNTAFSPDSFQHPHSFHQFQQPSQHNPDDQITIDNTARIPQSAPPHLQSFSSHHSLPTQTVNSSAIDAMDSTELFWPTSAGPYPDSSSYNDPAAAAGQHRYADASSDYPSSSAVTAFILPSFDLLSVEPPPASATFHSVNPSNLTIPTTLIDYPTGNSPYDSIEDVPPHLHQHQFSQHAPSISYNDDPISPSDREDEHRAGSKAPPNSEISSPIDKRHQSLPSEERPRTKSGNKPRTTLTKDQKLELIQLSTRQPNLTQENIAARFE